MQNILTVATGAVRTLSTALQGGPDGLVEQARHYVEAARTRINTAIAEGQATAVQTRQDLEARLAAAKADPASARSSFGK